MEYEEGQAMVGLIENKGEIKEETEWGKNEEKPPLYRDILV